MATVLTWLLVEPFLPQTWHLTGGLKRKSVCFVEKKHVLGFEEEIGLPVSRYLSERFPGTSLPRSLFPLQVPSQPFAGLEEEIGLPGTLPPC